MKITKVTTIEQESDVRVYGKIVAIITTTTSAHYHHNERHNAQKKGTELTLLRKSFFDRMKKSYGNDWFQRTDVKINIPHCEYLWVITKVYLKHYLQNSGYCFGDGRRYIESIRGQLAVLHRGKFEQVVHDALSYNGLFYDADGKPVLRSIHFDYIYGHIQSKEGWNVSAAAAHLRKHRKVCNVEIIDVPYYNGGGRAVEFDYLPSKKEFQQLVLSGDDSSYREKGDPPGGIDFEKREKILQSLKVEQFQNQRVEIEEETYDW